jgi:diketogulonate reductase-like aldo/keto reductase
MGLTEVSALNNEFWDGFMDKVFMDKDSKLQLHTGSRMPVFGLGTWELTNDTAGSVLYALELGYRLIDTSSDYGTQPGIGEAIKKSNIDRENIHVTTKVEETDDAYARIKSNLHELGLEYIDLMLVHRPPVAGAGEQLWADLIRAKEEGLIIDIGVSNYSSALIEKLIEASGQMPTVNQIEWSPFGWSQDMMKYCEDKNIIIQAYSPLTRTKRIDNNTLAQIGEKYQKSPAQILIRWNLQLGTCPLPKANQKKHLEENINVFDFQLNEDDMNRLGQFNEKYSSLGSLPYI